MPDFISLSLTAIFLSLGCIHLYWVFGGNWGSDSVVPQLELEGRPAFIPGVGITFLMVLVFWSMAAVILAFSGFFQTPIERKIYRWCVAAISAIFFLRAFGDFRYVGFFKKVRGTKFAYWDTRIYSPLCLGIGILTSYLAITQ
ncbi:DUF3995 domain-containing protein [Leptospira fainei]|nr:DUF3995 domain-containing protein [Leptospira fainei]